MSVCMRTDTWVSRMWCVNSRFHCRCAYVSHRFDCHIHFSMIPHSPTPTDTNRLRISLLVINWFTHGAHQLLITQTYADLWGTHIRLRAIYTQCAYGKWCFCHRFRYCLVATQQPHWKNKLELVAHCSSHDLLVKRPSIHGMLCGSCEWSRPSSKFRCTYRMSENIAVLIFTFHVGERLGAWSILQHQTKTEFRH